MASVDQAVQAFMQQRGAPLTAENMNRARQFLVEQQPALLNNIMQQIDQGRNVTLGGRGADLFDGGGGDGDDAESQMDDFMRRSDGDDGGGDTAQSGQQTATGVPTPRQMPGRQQVPQGQQSQTPPTPRERPDGVAGGGQGTVQGGQSATSATPQGGDDGFSVFDSLDEIIMAALGTRAALPGTRGGVNVRGSPDRTGAGPDVRGAGPTARGQTPQLEDVQQAQFEGVRGNARPQAQIEGGQRTLPQQQGPGVQLQQQTANARQVEGPSEGAAPRRLSDAMVSRRGGGSRGQRPAQGGSVTSQQQQRPGTQPQVTGEQQPQQAQTKQRGTPADSPVADVERSADIQVNTQNAVQQFNDGRVSAEQLKQQFGLEFQSAQPVPTPDRSNMETALILQNAEGDTFTIGTRTGQVYFEGRPIDGAQIEPTRIREFLAPFMPGDTGFESLRRGDDVNPGRIPRAVGGAF